uniref:transposase n=1 Tax=Streptomyces rishiriensis TaxID=68264 RepID=UPI0035A23895
MASVGAGDCGRLRIRPHVCFRLVLEERGWSYIVAVEPKEIARPAGAKPELPPYQGRGPPTLPRYREPARPLHQRIDAHTRFEDVTWQKGSRAQSSTALESANGISKIPARTAAADGVRPRAHRSVTGLASWHQVTFTTCTDAK